jgi:iron complex outermembrane receptor protein
MGDLNGFVPGLVVSGDSPTQPRYQIRGIQTGDFGVGTDPAVGVYVDGIYAARSGASMLAFNDIERIEVLKGPQGTLFGRNSAAGAISIVTTQPSQEFDSVAAWALRRIRQAVLRGMLNTPIGDRRAAHQRRLQQERRLAAGRGHRQDLAPEENWAGRVALRWDLSDKTSATLSWDHDNLDQLARPRSAWWRLMRALRTRPTRRPLFDRASPDLQRRGRQRGIAQARPGQPVHRPPFGQTKFRSSTSWRRSTPRTAKTRTAPT